MTVPTATSTWRLARLKEAGLVRERTTQRTDSTHVLAAVRDLTRLELITEAVRAALDEVAGISPHLLDELVDEDWGRRYGRAVRLGKNPTRRTSGPRVQALRRIMVQNYHRDAAGHLRWRTAEKEDGPGCRPRPGRSSRPTTPRPATHAMDTSSAGRGSPLT
ncbi:hypothetical protein PV379_12085 [Streptomyces caniscabiei]|uniref:hypothetical protein n=1 Tax=Streptomyces caniscabiei TaxID=2746961 RepID=UPI0029A090EA|nr:hypothetical protein [Streptomyces caniscabiei]MDX2778046.1 hypothetical protein [Streptomyces caniscabiei]